MWEVRSHMRCSSACHDASDASLASYTLHGYRRTHGCASQAHIPSGRDSWSVCRHPICVLPSCKCVGTRQNLHHQMHLRVLICEARACMHAALTLQVWSGPTHWPDFTHPAAPVYWQGMLSGLHEAVPFDGLWLVRRMWAWGPELNGWVWVKHASRL